MDRSAGGTLSDYVSTGGDVYVRVRCTSSSVSFHTSADQLRVVTTRP